MKNNNNQKNEPLAVQTMEFLKKYWLFITMLIIGLPYLKRFIDSQQQQTEQQKLENQIKSQKAIKENEKENKLIANQNPLTQAQKRLTITASKDLHAASASLAVDFGVKYSDSGKWYDIFKPKGWTENDENARKTLVLYRNYFPYLEKLYYQVDTNSRSLRADILELLDKDELTYLRKYLKI